MLRAMHHAVSTSAGWKGVSACCHSCPVQYADYTGWQQQWLQSEPPRLARELARRERTTIFVPLATVWHLLRQRYSRDDDIVVGTALGRT